MTAACGPLCLALLVVMTTLHASSGSPFRSQLQPGIPDHDSRKQSKMAAVERERRISRIARDYFRRKSASSSMRRHWHVIGQTPVSPPDLILVLLAGAGGDTTDSLYRAAAAVDHVVSTDSSFSLSFPIVCNIDPHPDLHGPAQEIKGHMPSVQRYGVPPPPGVAFHPDVLRHNDTSQSRNVTLDLAFCLQVALSYRPRNLLLLREDVLDQGIGEPAPAVSMATGGEDPVVDQGSFMSSRYTTLVGRSKLRDGMVSETNQESIDAFSKAEYDEISAPLRDIIHILWGRQPTFEFQVRAASSAALFPRQPRIATLDSPPRGSLLWEPRLSALLCLWVFMVTFHVVWCWWRRTPPDGRFLLLAACLVLALHLLASSCGLLDARDQQDELGVGFLRGGKEEVGQEEGVEGQTGHKWTLRAAFCSSSVAEKLATHLVEEWDGKEPLDKGIVRFVHGLSEQSDN